MEQELVSVIIPVYNAEKYIANTIESVLSQTYSNVELILIDDGSTDNSLCVLKKYEKDKRVRIVSETNHGAPYERNLGLSLANGEYIVFFDADDVMKPNYIEKLHSAILGNDLAVGCYETISSSGKILSQTKITTETECFLVNDENLYSLQSKPPFPGNKMFRRSVVEKYNIRFADVRIGQDLNFYLKYMGVCKKVSLIEDVVSQYRLVNGSISNKVTNKILDIVDSINDVESFYLNCGASERAIKNLNDLRISHYMLQADKFVFFPTIKEGKKIYKYFYDQVIIIKKNNAVGLHASSIKKLKLMRIRWRLGFLFFNRFYFQRCQRLKKASMGG